MNRAPLSPATDWSDKNFGGVTMALSSKIWLPVLAFLAGSHLYAATSPTPAPAAEPALPAGLTMPFRVIGIDAEEAAQSRPALEQSIVGLAASWLQAPLPLSKVQAVAANPLLTLNARTIADKIITGTPKSPVTGTSLAVEAAWCSFMDRHVFVVTVADAKTNRLLGSRHTTIARPEWKKLAAKGQEGFLQSRLPTLLGEALGEARGRAAKPLADAAHLGFYLGENTTRRDEGSAFCPTLLLEEKLAADFTVARALGADRLATTRTLVGAPPHLTRPSRGVILAWRQQDPEDPKRQLPLTLDLPTSFAENVFGQHINAEPKTSAVQFSSGTNSTIAFTVPPALVQYLKGEQQSLLLADAPAAVKIDRAWVYLDRGRAFGLKMNDRVIAEVDGKIVKGHVVNFFGPGLNLKSPRGFPIREGAIVFIRKGQKLTKLGMTFKPDPRKFGTPYPIPAGG